MSLWDDQIIPRETAVAVVESSVESFASHGFGIWTLSLKNAPKLIGFDGLRHFTVDGGEEGAAKLTWPGLRSGPAAILAEIHSGLDSKMCVK